MLPITELGTEMADFAPDLSSYPKPAQQNGLDQAGKATDLMGQFAVGQGIQQAIQPDGTIDRNVLAQVLKGSIAGSMQAPQALTAIERLRQAGHSADIEAIRNQVSQMDYTGKLLGPLADKKTVSKDELIDVAGKAIHNATKLGLTGYIPDVAKFLQQTNGDPNMTDQKRAQIVRDHHFQSQSVQRQLEAELPQVTPYNTGARTGTTVTGSQRNPQGISMAVEPPPTTATADTRKTLPNGKPNPNYGQPLIIGAGSSAPPPITRTDASGRIIPTVRQATDSITGYEGMPTSNGQPVRLAQPGDGTQLGKPGPIATGLVPGEAAPMAASGEAYAKDLADSRNYAERMNPLKQAIPLVEKLGKSGTGPGQETVQHLKAFAQVFGIPTINQNTVKSYAELKKYLSQNAAAVAPPGTNIPSVLNAFEANPNVQQPQEAVAELSKMLYALGRMRQASVLAFQKTGLPGGQYTDWASKWAPQQDVRGYMADLMTPEQRKDLLSKIKKGSPQAAKISGSYTTAKGLNLLGDVERP
jgi:hypothetical protein